MPAKRTYNITASKDFLVLAGIFFFLCLWAIKDGWKPSPKVLEKHPLTVEASFAIDGTVGQIYVGVGDSVSEGQTIALLRQTQVALDLAAAKKEYIAARDTHVLAQETLRNAEQGGVPVAELADLRASMDQAKIAVDDARKKIEKARAIEDASELRAPSKGDIQEIRKTTHQQVEAGEAVLVINPKDHFYLFNKSLAILSFIAFFIFIGLHLFAY